MLLVFSESLTLNIYLEVQTGVSYYVTSFYRMTYPEHLPGSPDWCFLLWVRLSVTTSNIVGNTSLDFQVEVQGKAFCKN
jgi:hypothetical protein